MIDLSRYYFAPLGDLLCTSKRKAADGPLEIEELDKPSCSRDHGSDAANIHNLAPGSNEQGCKFLAHEHDAKQVCHEN
jgi:hypothetical protein